MIVSIFAPHTIRKGEKAGQIVPGFRPTRWDTSWADMVAVLGETATVPADRSDKSAVNCIAMADFRDGENRSLKSALRADWIGIDIDNKEGLDPDAWTIESLSAFLDELHLAYCIYTTASSRQDAQCLRLLIPFDSPVSADEWPEFWPSVDLWLRGKLDPSTKDISRLFFEPRAWTGAYNRFVVKAGETLSPYYVMNKHPAQTRAPVITDVARTIASGRYVPIELRTVDDIADIDASPVVTPAVLETALTSPRGHRLYKFLVAVACNAVRQNIALSQPELERLGNQLAARLGRRTTGIDRDAERALEYASRTVVDKEARTIAKFTSKLRGIW